MEGVGWFWDHSQNKSILAHNLVSTHYIAGKFRVPLDFDVFDSWYMNEELPSFIREKGIGAYVAEEEGTA